MEIADVVAEFVELSRQARSGPLAAQQQHRWQELKTLLLVAQRQQPAAGKDAPTAESAQDWRTRR